MCSATTPSLRCVFLAGLLMAIHSKSTQQHRDDASTIVIYYAVTVSADFKAKIEQIYPRDLCRQDRDSQLPENSPNHGASGIGKQSRGFKLDGRLQRRASARPKTRSTGPQLYMSWLDIRNVDNLFNWPTAQSQCAEGWTLAPSILLQQHQPYVRLMLQKLQHKRNQTTTYAWIDGRIKSGLCPTISYFKDKVTYPRLSCDHDFPFICSTE